jgi:hypothetical protein
MRRIKRAFVLIIAPLLGIPPGFVRAEVDFGYFWRLSPSIFKIETHNRNGGSSVGSGVLVGDGLIVTNCHVTRNATYIQIAKQSLRWDVTGQVSDLEHDLCLLRAPNVIGQAAPISPSQPKVGQMVIAMGYVGGNVPQMSGGEVRALYRFDGSRVIQSSAWFNSGASGGGLFDYDGNLIGIISFRHQGGEGYHFALPVDWIFRHSLDLDRAREVTPLGQGLAFWQQSGDQQPYFLKAAALEATNDWPALRELAKKWTASETDNPDGWLSLGKAFLESGDYDQAIAAYGRAIQSDLESAEAWYSLGLAYKLRGRQNQLQEVQRVLLTLDENLAIKLSAPSGIH